LGLGRKPKITPSVIQPVMVDMVNKQMLGRSRNYAMHRDVLAVFFSNGVIIPVVAVRVPFILAQLRIIFGIDNRELPPRQRYPPGSLLFSFFRSKTRRVKVRTFLVQGADFPPAFGAFLLPANKNGPACTRRKRRKAAIIAAFFVRHEKN
jgi:hypothetical protein